MKQARVLFLIILSLFLTPAFCSVEQDSLVLIKKLTQATNAQQKINANIALAKFYLSRSLTKASAFVSSAKFNAQKANNNEGLADAFTLEGEINYSLANYDLAKSNYTEALSLFNKETQQLSIGEAYSGLGKIAYKQDEFDASITTEMQTRFATEKKQQENEILNLQVKIESFIKTIFIIAAGLLLVIAFFIFRGLRQKQKANIALEEKNKIIEEQKQTVEHQKYIVEEQNKDITDSIRYAERIQTAILPPDKLWHTLFP